VVTALSTAHAAVLVGATLQADRRAELAIDVHRATGIVIAAVGAGKRVIRFVDAAFQPRDIADWEALAIYAADVASATFFVGAARVFPNRNAVDTATPPAGSTAFRSTRHPPFTADRRRLSSRIGRRAFVDYFGAGVDRRIGGCSLFRRRRVGRWNFFRRRSLLRRRCLIYRRRVRRRRLFDRGRLLYDRIDRRICSRLENFLVFRICSLAAEGGGADKSTEKSFEHKATR
jgi:hypothetical protein